MSKSLHVLTLTRGYYGGEIKEPGDEFTISSPDELGSWMLPQGWSKEKPKPTKAAKEAAAKLDAEKAPAKPEDAKPFTFKGMKAEYGSDEHQFKSADIVARAIEDYEHGVKEWNELSDKERQKNLMAAVAALVNEAQAEAAAT